MGVAAAIAFVVVLRLSACVASSAGIVPFISALAGAAGGVLVGMLTVRARRFPAWVGWLLAVWGTINVGTGLVVSVVDLKVLAGVGELLGALAIAGYGWTIVQAGRVDSAALGTA
jgi:hypothetical protein